jgi:hypothetical protein
MLRTNNVFDTVELKKTCEHYSITDNVADKVLNRVDLVLDAIKAFSVELDDLMVDLDVNEGCTLAERRAIYLSLTKIFKRSVDFKCEAVSK